jgi:hypothetical protein
MPKQNFTPINNPTFYTVTKNTKKPAQKIGQKKKPQKEEKKKKKNKTVACSFLKP